MATCKYCGVSITWASLPGGKWRAMVGGEYHVCDAFIAKVREGRGARKAKPLVAKGLVIRGKFYHDDGIERDWPPWEDGPDAVEAEFSDEAIGERLRGL
jgi:hypothetical protein